MSGLLASTTSGAEAFQFWLLGGIAVAGALGTVLLRRAVHSALCLAGTMIILAIFYLANGAYFLGVVQIVVYTGAVMMLFLFVLMLVGVSTADSLKETLRGQRWMAVLCALGLGILVTAGIGQAALGSFTGVEEANALHGGNVPGIAEKLFTEYVVAFEITGVLLTVAAVGATLLTHRERIEKAKSQREQAEARTRSAHVPPLPAPGVYALHNAVDRPGLLPDGSPSELTVNPTLRERGQMREVSADKLAALAALEQRTAEYHGTGGGPANRRKEARRSLEQPDEPEPADTPPAVGDAGGPAEGTDTGPADAGPTNEGSSGEEEAK
ncbi:NADH-quinone oxidoreductase subunit J [Streptomyces alkaliterrae]|uniref:NADH-quinone oxidoreductase subunit J n=1 Tax=Streptomyces alkaliterrae TaxID=2213162 RepID=A0A5P0YU79_9ACTN|nr:NADH-quinone oxidoreductase subunit J [Streptomyces alkaliterrae]MBB1254268.1 NADH-quinone oxidoreductase subunit J [Streptomyces alkaliterrae]MBB1259609.1 NADH-quinone oxidoreductase subunit J [Streptomyces alkaliterrae]MQS03177.1 NADH-quinone oxidoreductase subunit J [Streptomyces alkaliterrae]